MDLDIISSLRTDFGEIYDENFKLKDKTKLVNFNKELEKIGISSKLTPKEIELRLQQIYETLTKFPNKTTLNKDESEQLIKEAGKRDADILKTRENQSKLVKDFIDAQQKIQADITNAQKLQTKFQDKVVYAKVIIPDPLPLDEVEQKDLETLREFAQADEVTRTKLIDDLATKIESKLENVPKEQKILIARTAAVEIVEKLAKPEVAIEAQVQTAILSAIHEDKTKVLPIVLQKDDALLIAAKNGATLLELKNINSDFFTKDIAKNLFGPRLAEAIYGSDKIQVVLSEIKTEGQTTHQVNLGDLNQNYVQQLEHQNSVLNSVKEFGIDKTQSFFTGQARTYLAEKMASMPAGSIIKKTYSSPITQSILARYGLANPVVWEAVSQSQFVDLAMKFAPDAAGPILSFAGKALGKEFVKPVVGQAVRKIAVQTGIKAGFGAFLAKGAAAIGVSLGVFTAGVSTAITIATVAIGKLINWPKVKKWFIDNIEIFVIGGAGLGLMLGGPVAGLVTGGLLMAATGTLGAFAMGAFGVLGFIGRSVGIAIATPVIVTLLIIPPLVAFIMLVINNSAYVVPPSFESGGGGYTPEECLGKAPPKPIASNIKYSSDGKYAYPVAPFEVPGYACYHWDGNKAADIFSPQIKPPMVAYESGTIANVTLNDSLGGKYIILRGASGRHYYYAHLCHVFVGSGESVNVGDVIATMDETGSGRVQHLHYAINEPPLTDIFMGGDGNVCPQEDFEEKFGFGVCNTGNYCVSP